MSHEDSSHQERTGRCPQLDTNQDGPRREYGPRSPGPPTNPAVRAHREAGQTALKMELHSPTGKHTAAVTGSPLRLLDQPHHPVAKVPPDTGVQGCSVGDRAGAFQMHEEQRHSPVSVSTSTRDTEYCGPHCRSKRGTRPCVMGTGARRGCPLPTHGLHTRGAATVSCGSGHRWPTIHYDLEEGKVSHIHPRHRESLLPVCPSTWLTSLIPDALDRPSQSFFSLRGLHTQGWRAQPSSPSPRF